MYCNTKEREKEEKEERKKNRQNKMERDSEIVIWTMSVFIKRTTPHFIPLFLLLTYN